MSRSSAGTGSTTSATPSNVALLESLVKEGREAGEMQDDARVRGAIEKLEKEAHRVSSAAYQGAGGTETGGAAAPEPATEASASSKNPNAGVVDAEFEEASVSHPPPGTRVLVVRSRVGRRWIHLRVCRLCSAAHPHSG